MNQELNKSLKIIGISVLSTLILLFDLLFILGEMKIPPVSNLIAAHFFTIIMIYLFGSIK